MHVKDSGNESLVWMQIATLTSLLFRTYSKQVLLYSSKCKMQSRPRSLRWRRMRGIIPFILNVGAWFNWLFLKRKCLLPYLHSIISTCVYNDCNNRSGLANVFEGSCYNCLEISKKLGLILFPLPLEDCKTFSPMSRIGPVTARPAPLR